MPSTRDTTGMPARVPERSSESMLAVFFMGNLAAISEGFGAAWGISFGSYLAGATFGEAGGSLLFWLVLVHFVAVGLVPPVVGFATFRGSDEKNLGELMLGLAKVVGFLFPRVALRAIQAILWRHRLVSCVLAALFVVDHYAPSIHTRLPGSVLSRRAVRCGYQALKMLWEVPRAVNRRYEEWEDQRAERSSAAVPRLVYHVLNVKRREIRVLRLRRRTWRPELACDFVKVSVDDAERLCPFEAISYTWRGEKRTVHVLISGRRLAVTPTVARLLRYRRSFFSEAFLWIDGVCINQNDTAERGSQVLLMGDIYRHAERTRVWLAHPSEARGASEARGVMASLLSIDGLLHVTKETRMAMLEDIVLTDVKMPAVAALLARSYFHRVWVVQEVALAKEVLVTYGDIVMEWDALVRVAQLLLHPRLIGQIHGRRDGWLTTVDVAGVVDLSRHMANIAQMDAMRKLCQGDSLQRRSLTLHRALTEMELYCFRATDPHDKLYGVLGLVSDPGFIGPGEADYQEPVRELYMRTARYLIMKTRSLSVLQYAGTRPMPFMNGLPSWVPDWHGNARRRIAWSASSTIRDLPPYTMSNQDWTEIENRSRLEVEIRMLDTVVLAADSVMLAYLADEVVCGDIGRVVDISATMPAYNDNIALAASHIPTQQMYPDLPLAVFRALIGAAHSPKGLPSEKAETYETFQFLLRGVRSFDQSAGPEDGDGEDGENRRNKEKERWLAGLGTKVKTFFLAEGLDPTDLYSKLLDSFELAFRLGQVAGGKRFCVLASGRIALLPSGAQVGDEVVYIRTAPVPFALRRKMGNSSDAYPALELVGSCYVLDMSDECLDVDGWTRVSLV